MAEIHGLANFTGKNQRWLCPNCFKVSVRLLTCCWLHKWQPKYFYHGDNGGTLGMVPLIINPIYTLYNGYLLGIPMILKIGVATFLVGG